jgi:hypothetical protein
MEGIFAIIGVFGSIPLIIWIVYYYRSKAHNRMSGLIGKMIEKGDTVTPETIRALGIQPGNPHRDVKTGMVLISIAFALIVFGQVIPEDEAATVMLGFATFPLFVGIALITFWYFFGRKNIAG